MCSLLISTRLIKKHKTKILLKYYKWNICTYIVNTSMCTESTNKVHVNSIIMVAYEGRKETGQGKGKKLSSTAPVFDFFLKERKR